MNKQVNVRHLGQVRYQAAWDYQTGLFEHILAQKALNRQRDAEGEAPLSTDNYLLLVEHPPVYTLGKSGKEQHLLLNEESLRARGIDFHHINRGGDITFHGPGQIVCYPVFDMENFFADIHRYMRTLEEAVIRTCADYGLSAGRIEGLTGVWLGHAPGDLRPRKICAMGVKTSRWVSMHGLAFNVNTDLSYFGSIVPCGISDKAVTSLQAELGRELPMAEVETRLLGHLQELFDFQPVYEQA